MGAEIAGGVMEEPPRIPVQNLYYLLCYAWNHLKQGELVDVSNVPSTELADLFAVVLCDGVQHLARRGLEQGYQLQEEAMAGVRGRVDIFGSYRRFLPAHGRALCQFDELTPNTLANQILKSTLRSLSLLPTLNSELRKRVKITCRDLHGIDEICLTNQSFGLVQLHSNNRFYRFLLDVCELVHGSWLIEPKSGEYRFRDFTRDEKAMARVFQNFLFHFIRIEVACWKVEREEIQWRAQSATDPSLALIPRMETDISLSRPGQHVIVDAKYYQNTLSNYFDTKKFHAGNLYQLMGYLTNVRVKEGEALSGMLIYPRVDITLREKYTIQGFPIFICTVDLDRNWKDIKSELIELMHSL